MWSVIQIHLHLGYAYGTMKVPAKKQNDISRSHRAVRRLGLNLSGKFDFGAKVYEPIVSIRNMNPLIAPCISVEAENWHMRQAGRQFKEKLYRWLKKSSCFLSFLPNHHMFSLRNSPTLGVLPCVLLLFRLSFIGELVEAVVAHGGTGSYIWQELLCFLRKVLRSPRLQSIVPLDWFTKFFV